jgi:signal transduction histidine kinase
MRHVARDGTDEHDRRAERAGRFRRYRRSLRGCAEQLRREREARAAAESAATAKDGALAAICHDLRTPLNAILGWAQVGRLGSTGGSELDEALSRIDASARLQAKLINDILDLAKGANGTLRIDRQRVDLNQVVTAAVAVVEPLAGAKQVRVERTTPPVPALVSGDPVRLQRVAWNLLTNAVKFTPAGGRVSVEVEAGAEAVRLRVSDTGRGISPAFLPRVFERFQQDPSAGASREAGAGLGLAIVRALVQAHGGTVVAESAGEGLGASFTVSIPRLHPPV